MKLTALGVWGGFPYQDAGTTSYLLTSNSGFNLMIDAGSRAVTELEHEVSPLYIDAVIVSHYHQIISQILAFCASIVSFGQKQIPIGIAQSSKSTGITKTARISKIDT